MRLLHIPAVHRTEFEIPKDLDKFLQKNFKKNSTLAIFCVVQFRENLEEFSSYLEKLGYNFIISKTKRTLFKGQILGCNSFKESLGFDISLVQGFIYLGEGYFHPNALLLSQEHEDKIKPVVVVDVFSKKFELIGEDHIKKYLGKKKANLANFYMQKDIGVFISTKWGQSYEKVPLTLKQMYPDKNFYFFIGDSFMDYEMENFPFIKVFVNTACPRIGQDDVLRHPKPVVNINDILTN